MDSQEINFIEASYVESNLPILIGVIIFFVALLVFIIGTIIENQKIIRATTAVMAGVIGIVYVTSILHVTTGPLARTYATIEEYTHLTTDELKDRTYDPEVMTDIIQDHGFDGWAKYVGDDRFSPVSKYDRPREIIPYIVNDEAASELYSFKTDQIYLYTSKDGCNQYYQVTQLHGTPKDSFGRSYWNGKVTIEPYQEICSEK